MTKTHPKLRSLRFSAKRESACAEETSQRLHLLPTPPPEDFESFLSNYGGGSFEQEVVVLCKDPPPPHASDHRCLFGEFLDLDDDGETSLSTVWRRTQDLISEGLTPFATVAGGDFYCLRVQETGTDIVLWDHDTANSYSVADSFSDFVDRLEVAPRLREFDPEKIGLKLSAKLLNRLKHPDD
ncbi:MAG: SMI1/KNR4 family protein [Candidatus Lindowbacteria bacterium]|nr:SMI1/KNR4 family protein [Candidatus Lindowbacteria bacterium]